MSVSIEIIGLGFSFIVTIAGAAWSLQRAINAVRLEIVRVKDGIYKDMSGLRRDIEARLDREIGRLDHEFNAVVGKLDKEITDIKLEIRDERFEIGEKFVSFAYLEKVETKLSEYLRRLDVTLTRLADKVDEINARDLERAKKGMDK